MRDEDAQEEKDSSDDDDEEEIIDSTPTYIDLGCKGYEPAVDVTRDDFSPVPTVFKINTDEGSEQEATAKNVMSKYINKKLIDNIVESSNKYRCERKNQLPHLKIWSLEKNFPASRPITASCVYHFIALIYYFGLVKLPSKRDYWNRSSIYMPIHSIAKELGMNRDRFFLCVEIYSHWRDFNRRY